MRKLPILEELRVAKPCAAEWAAMTGNEEARHCAHCNQNVYNLSELTRAQADELVRTANARLCMRYYHRADGTMLLRDGAVAYRPARLIAAGLAVAALTGAGLALTRARAQEIERDVHVVAGSPMPMPTPPPAVAVPLPPPTVALPTRVFETKGQTIAIDREILVTGGAAPVMVPPAAPEEMHRARRR